MPLPLFLLLMGIALFSAAHQARQSQRRREEREVVLQRLYRACSATTAKVPTV